MSVETAFETLRRINPVPDPAALRAQLEAESGRAATIPSRRHTMDTITRHADRPVSPAPQRTRRWLPAVAAAGLILVTAPFVLLREGSPFRDSTQSPLQVAEAYVEARNAYDADAVRGLLADDIARPDPWASNNEELELAIEARRLYGVQIMVDCAPVPDQPNQVTCTGVGESELERVVGAAPASVELWFAFDDDGRISTIAEIIGDSEGFALYQQWLRDTHPEAALILYGWSSPNLTPEAVELRPVVLADYLDSVRAGS